MQEVIIEKLNLFGSVGKAHLHDTPYAAMLANQAYSLPTQELLTR
jgi:tagatose 1,6-diphosphate aldolase GatY/KbaY